MADPTLSPPLTRDGVRQAHALIAPLVHRTPVLTNATLTRLASTPRAPRDLEGTEWAGRTPAAPRVRLWFKCENLQRIGAFKARGALHAVERLKLDEGWVAAGGKERGVVTHSSGRSWEGVLLFICSLSLLVLFVGGSRQVTVLDGEAMWWAIWAVERRSRCTSHRAHVLL